MPLAIGLIIMTQESKINFSFLGALFIVVWGIIYGLAYWLGGSASTFAAMSQILSGGLFVLLYFFILVGLTNKKTIGSRNTTEEVEKVLFGAAFVLLILDVLSVALTPWLFILEGLFLLGALRRFSPVWRFWLFYVLGAGVRTAIYLYA